MKDTTKKIEDSINVYFVRDHIEGAFPPAFEVFVANLSSDKTFENLTLLSQALYEDIASTAPKKELGDLLPETSISINKSDVYELDALIGYYLRFVYDGEDYLIKFGIKRPEGNKENVPGTDFDGIAIKYSLSNSVN